MNGKPMTTKVYENIYSDIINGVITTNDILSEGRLAEKYRVSRAPVREALISLCNEGLLQSIPRTGYKVMHILPREAEEMIELRRVLELHLLNASFDHLTQEDIAALQTVHLDNQKEEALKTRVQDHWERNMRFHLTLAEMGGNGRMKDTLEKTLLDCARASTQYFLGSRNHQTQDDLHGPLLDALLSKDKPRALSILEKDIRALIY
ncbi:MAG: GntR family transcriptional regulator [Clostridiales bacterium]|jgi:DNA-binding GntR family transcriptional regulator|nr:GntR family transcriptional regulator [Eubacteriales bacterium]MDD4710496.1 GntR family transcriptional regulator [Eubacteriales bacterium]NLO15074.1 GntR family transcriptional regulator [Clostridiales bacterium]